MAKTNENNLNITPSSQRIHIAIFGKTNAGKSSILNALLDQQISIVSAKKGTTTDPVRKFMEFLPLGPVEFIDTAGVDDNNTLGKKRLEKTKKILHETDFAIYVIDSTDKDYKYLKEYKSYFIQFNIPFMVVYNKIDLISKSEAENLVREDNNCSLVDINNKNTIGKLKDKIIENISKLIEKERSLIGDLLPYNSSVILVIPIDSEAPKGRLIPPQNQLIRDCLDHGIKCYITRDTELGDALDNLSIVDLVVTDSQAFKEVAGIIPKNIKLTSFSIILSRIKGDLDIFINSVYKLDDLPNGAKILIAESCTHNSTCEDIGRVKIPKLIKSYTNKEFSYTIMSGKDFPDNLSEFDYVIHCAGCIFNSKTMRTRIKMCQDMSIPITNYGVVLAYMNGILERATEIFK